MANKLFEFLGLNVIYRSKRRGFTYYVLGQLKEIARSIYGHEELRVEVKRQEIVFDTVVVNFRYNLYDSSGFPRKKETPNGFFKKNPTFIVRYSSSFPLLKQAFRKEAFQKPGFLTQFPRI